VNGDGGDAYGSGLVVVVFAAVSKVTMVGDDGHFFGKY
jgi:hypothetical protein